MNANEKAFAACRDLYRVQQEIKQAAHDIHECMNACRAEDYDNDGQHLYLAYSMRHEANDYCDERLMADDEINDLLSEGGDLECQHCLKAHNLVLHRKELKKLRGKIRRAITMIGKSAFHSEKI